MSENRRGKGHIKEAIARKVIAEIGHVPFQIVYDARTEVDAFTLEAAYISMHGRICNGTGILANMTTGWEGASGVKQSEISKRRKSESNLRPETRAQKSKALREAFAKPEVKKRLSDGQKRARSDPTTAAKLDKIRRDCLYTEAADSKRREGLKRAFACPERKAATSLRFTKIWSDPAYREKMSKMHKERLARKRAFRHLLLIAAICV